MKQQPYKRQYRELSDETKEKIRQSMLQQPQRSQEWCDKISQSLKDYWQNVPHKPEDNSEDTI